jgi:iron-sulfur cluster assembly protein
MMETSRSMSAETTAHAHAKPAATETTSEPRPEPRSEGKVASIEVTPKAVEAIKKQIAKRRGRGNASEGAAATEPAEMALRVGIRGGGCSGFSYVIEFHDGPPRARDRVYDHVAEDGTPVRVVVDPKSLVYLNGTVLDWEMTLMNQGFKFINPLEKSSCGCGHSFTV